MICLRLLLKCQQCIGLDVFVMVSVCVCDVISVIVSDIYDGGVLTKSHELCCNS